MAGPWDKVDYEGYIAATRTEPEMHGLDGWCNVLGIEFLEMEEAGAFISHQRERENIQNIFDEIITRINANSDIEGFIPYSADKGLIDYLTNMHPINRNRDEWDPNYDVMDRNEVSGVLNRDLYSYQGIQQLLIEQDNSWDYANPPQNSIIYQYKPSKNGGGTIILNYITRIYNSDSDEDVGVYSIDLDSTINWVWWQGTYSRYEDEWEEGYVRKRSSPMVLQEWNSCDPWVQGTGLYGYKVSGICANIIGFISFLSLNKRGFFINWPLRPPHIGE